MKTWSIACAALLALGASSAQAIDDRFNPAAYPKGGFAPANDALYRKECGACHFAYQPGLLPARSWRAIMGAKDHYGESLDFPQETAGKLEQYLVENAADRSDYLGSKLVLDGGGVNDRIRDDFTPLRITALPLFRYRHFSIAYRLGWSPRIDTARPFPPAAVKGFLNCNECHEKADTGSYAERDIVVKGVTKVVRPGGLF